MAGKNVKRHNWKVEAEEAKTRAEQAESRLQAAESHNESMATGLSESRDQTRRLSAIIERQANEASQRAFRTVTITVADGEGSEISTEKIRLNKGDFLHAQVNQEGWIDKRIKHPETLRYTQSVGRGLRVPEGEAGERIREV